MSWKNDKRSCDTAAYEHAHGGEDKREFYRTKGLGERYDKTFREWSDRLEAEREKENRLAPLHDLASRADALSYSDSEEVCSLARLIGGVVDYLHEKESNNG